MTIHTFSIVTKTTTTNHQPPPTTTNHNQPQPTTTNNHNHNQQPQPQPQPQPPPPVVLVTTGVLCWSRQCRNREVSARGLGLGSLPVVSQRQVPGMVVHRYTARAGPRHQGGEGLAGTPGACSQVFCHPIRCMHRRRVWRDTRRTQ